MPIYGRTNIAHNSVIFGPIPNVFIEGYSGEDYLPDKLFVGWVGCISKLSSMQTTDIMCKLAT